MAAPSLLTKKLWTELTPIKNFNRDNNLNQGKFFYETSSLEGQDEASESNIAQNAIVGRLWLTSSIYKNHALRIEIHLPPEYPLKPPEVVLKTPIYHPNVNEKDRICVDRLDATVAWNNKSTLTQILEIIVDTLDNPTAENSPVNPEAASEFIKNRAEYERKATAMIEKKGLSRS